MLRPIANNKPNDTRGGCASCLRRHTNSNRDKKIANYSTRQITLQVGRKFVEYGSTRGTIN